MVRLAFSLLFLFFNTLLLAEATGFASNSDWKLKTVFSKQKIFEGEGISAQYFLETRSPMRAVEIEVMKFPEFRNFWSENTILRQGMIQLFSFPNSPEVSGTLMGAYQLYPMLGSVKRQIHPLRLLVKQFGDENVILLSEEIPLEVLSLPPIPSTLRSFSFFGGVGSFSLSSDRLAVPYRLKQPFRLELFLEGEGNFPELNSIPLSLPTFCSVLSGSSFSDFYRGRNKKIFQWDLSCEEEIPTSWKLQDLLFFDPQAAKYKTLSFPSFSWKLLPDLELEKVSPEKNQIVFEEEPSELQDWPDLSQSFWFWFIQGLVFLALFSLSFGILLQRKKVALQTDPSTKKKSYLKTIRRALKKNHFSDFLFWTSRLAESELKNPHWPQIPSHFWKEFIQAYHEFEFSPEKQTSFPFESLRKKWTHCEGIMKKTT